jgi:hypothetical protein
MTAKAHRLAVRAAYCQLCPDLEPILGPERAKRVASRLAETIVWVTSIDTATRRDLIAEYFPAFNAHGKGRRPDVVRTILVEAVGFAFYAAGIPRARQTGRKSLFAMTVESVFRAAGQKVPADLFGWIKRELDQDPRQRWSVSTDDARPDADDGDRQ